MTSSEQHFQKLSISYGVEGKLFIILSFFNFLEFVSCYLTPCLLCLCHWNIFEVLWISMVCSTEPLNPLLSCIHKWFAYIQILTCMSPFQSGLHGYFYAKYDLSTFYLHPFSASFSCGVCYGLGYFLIKGCWHLKPVVPINVILFENRGFFS